MIQSRFVRGSKCLDKLPKLLDLHRHAPARPYSSLEEDEDVFMVEDRRRLARLQIERQLQILGNEIRALGLPDENGPSHWTSESTLMNHDNGFQNPTPEEQTSSRLEEGILLDIENEKGPSVGEHPSGRFEFSQPHTLTRGSREKSLCQVHRLDALRAECSCPDHRRSEKQCPSPRTPCILVQLCHGLPNPLRFIQYQNTFLDSGCHQRL